MKPLKMANMPFDMHYCVAGGQYIMVKLIKKITCSFIIQK